MTREEILAAIRSARAHLDSEIYGLHVLVMCGRTAPVDRPLQLADLAIAAGLPVSAIKAARMDDTNGDIIAWICRYPRPSGCPTRSLPGVRHGHAVRCGGRRSS